MKTISKIMKKKVFTLDADETIQKAISLMEKENIKEIPITENNKFAGMITFYEIARLIGYKPQKVKSIMFMPPVVLKGDDILLALKYMLKSGVEAIPVLERETIIGIVSEYDILKEYLNDFKDERVIDFFRPNIGTISERDTLQEARRRMQFERIDRLAVLDENSRLSGTLLLIDIFRHCFVYEDLKGKMGDFRGEIDKLKTKRVKDVYRRDIKPVKIDDKITSVLKKMLSTNIKGLPVVNNKNEYLGILLRKDLLAGLSNLIEQKGIFVNFSGIKLSKEELLDLQSVIKDQINRIIYLTKNIERIDVHIKPVHDREKENRYLIQMAVMIAGEDFHMEEEGWDLIFTIQKLLKKTERIMRDRYGQA